MTFAWDPTVYRQFADARARPFADLVARIGAVEPRRVLDVGCGPGESTASLAPRWPSADVLGIDSSPDMLASAPTAPRVRFALGDARTVDTSGYDVVLSNAVLQWVPDHGPVLQRWAATLPANGWLAIQVPANFDAPSHALMREIAVDYPAAAGVLRGTDAVLSADAYASLLLDAGLDADVWHTTYMHVLDGEDAVLGWVRGTGLRPALAALRSDEADEFERRYSEALRKAYPRRADGRTVFAFKRIFAIGVRA